MARVRQKNDRRLEPLDLMQVHHANHVLTARFERQRLDLRRERSVLLDGLCRLGKVSTQLGHLAYAINRLQQVASSGTGRTGGRQRQQPGLIENLIDRGAGRQDPRQSIQLPEDVQRRGRPAPPRCGFG